MAKSETKIYEFEGIAKWAKLYEPDEFRGSSRYLINLHMDEKNEALYKRSGIQKNFKSDEDGKFITFSRDASKKLGKDFMEFSPPFIYGADGKPIVRYVDDDGRPRGSVNVKEGITLKREGDPIMIGNGSKVKVQVSVYNTQMGIGSRLENIRIIDLIEYKSAGGGRTDVISAENGVDEIEEGGEPVAAVDFTDLDTEPVAEKKGGKKPVNKTVPW